MSHHVLPTPQTNDSGFMSISSLWSWIAPNNLSKIQNPTTSGWWLAMWKNMRSSFRLRKMRSSCRHQGSTHICYMWNKMKGLRETASWQLQYMNQRQQRQYDRNHHADFADFPSRISRSLGNSPCRASQENSTTSHICRHATPVPCQLNSGP